MIITLTTIIPPHTHTPSHIQVAFPDPGEKKDVVTLRGPKEDVDKCFQYLKKMAAELVSNIAYSPFLALAVVRVHCHEMEF